MAKGKARDVLYRVVKFEINPNEQQIRVLKEISDNLKQTWNDALQERIQLYEEHIEPIYQRIKVAVLNDELDPAVIELRTELSEAYKQHKITLFDQIYALTPRRKRNIRYASTPRNWQEETLDTLDGAFKSYLALRKNGDPKARRPRFRNEWDFSEIPGRYGFRLLNDGKNVSLSCGKIGKDTSFVFPIPEGYQFGKLVEAIQVKKFTLYRDERDMRKKGRFWISLAYEIPKPLTKPFQPEEAVFISLGASFIGIVSSKGEEVIPLWRPDKHWKPKTDAINASLSRKTYFPIKKGSRKYRRLELKRQNMFRMMAAQQKQDRREIVKIDLLLYHGVHFVVSDLVVRSKKGKLADGSDLERSGSLGLNWSAQNTGSIAYLVQWLEEKTQEYGGTVRKHKLSGELPPGKGEENKLLMAKALRTSFLTSFKQAA